MSEEEGSVCLVCHEVLSVSAIGALRCGHVYHPNCIAQWLAQGEDESGECPQCKATNRTDAVRTLDFDVKAVPPQCPEELRRMESATLEERERRRQELATEKAEVVAMQGEVDSDLAQLKASAQDHSRAQREADQRSGVLQKQHLKLSALLLHEKELCATLQTSLDAQTVRLQCKRRPPPPCESDPDLRQERRKLRSGCRPADRARQLHEALTSALQQEREKMQDKSQPEDVLKKLEKELTDVRQLEAQHRAKVEAQQSLSCFPLSSQTSNNRAESASVSTSSTRHTAVASSGEADTVNGNLERSEAACAGLAQKKVVTDASAPPNGIVLLSADNDEDANVLYGRVRSGRTVSGSPVGLAAVVGAPIRSSAVCPAPRGAGIVATSGGKWGALFGASARRRPPVVQQMR